MSTTDGTSGILDDLTPADPLMAIAWADGLRWAIRQPDIIKAFRAETGVESVPGGYLRNLETGRRFVRWFNENIWGDMDIVAGQSSDEGSET